MRGRIRTWLRRNPRMLRAVNSVLLVSKRALARAQLTALIAVLALAKPFVRIRIARFRSEKLGHFISETDLALIGIQESWKPNAGNRREINYFVMPEASCNEQLRSMYLRSAREIPLIRVLDCRTSWWARRMLRPALLLTELAQEKGRFTEYFAGSLHSGGLHHTGLVSSSQPRLSFLDDERRRGWAQLDVWGISPATKYICIHVRDTAFLSASAPERDWSYHDYRNPNPLDYVPAIRHLLDREYTVLRMGRKAESRLDIAHPRFFDYAYCDAQSDFLDVFIYAHAFALVAGSASGIDNLGFAFNVPGIVLDLIPFQPHQAVPLVVVTPCMLRERATGRMLTLSEMRRHRYFRGDQYESAGLTIVRATPEQILATVDEGIQRAEGVRRDSSRQLERQSRFWAWAELCGIDDDIRLGPSKSTYYQHHIGDRFLEEYFEQLMT